MTKIPTLNGPIGKGAMAEGMQTNRVEEAKQLANRDLTSEKEIEKASKGFEALLLHQMLKSMWATVETTGMLGEDSNQAQIYRYMLNQALADSMSEGRGVGVKDFLKKELSKLPKAS